MQISDRIVILIGGEGTSGSMTTVNG